jgi:hypothetical protein
MSRQIFRIIIGTALAIALLLYVTKEFYNVEFLIMFSSLNFLIFSLGVHGLIAHSYRIENKVELTLFPLIMWVIWAILFLAFVFIILPMYCDNFLVDIS